MSGIPGYRRSHFRPRGVSILMRPGRRIALFDCGRIGYNIFVSLPE